MKAKLYTIFTMLLLFAMTSCEHKDLCFDHAHTVDVKVVFDWRSTRGFASIDGCVSVSYRRIGTYTLRFHQP